MKIDFDSLIDKKQIHKQTALRNSLIVMLCCTPLRMSEILSIAPESEVLDSLPNDTKCYGWRYKSINTKMCNDENSKIIWIPNHLAPLVRKAIKQITKLSAENLSPNFPFHHLSKSTPRISFSEYRAMHVSKMFRTGIES
jgi:hypothetical protein